MLRYFSIITMLISSTGVAQQMVAPDVISTGNIYAGCFSPSGDTMYFFRKVEPIGEEYQLYLSARNERGEFATPKRLTDFGDYSNLYPALSSDGNRMVYVSYRPAPEKFAAKKQAYIWCCDKGKDGKWKTPVFIQNVNFLDHYHSNIALTPNGDIVFRRLTADYKDRTTYIAYKDGTGYKDPILYEPAEQWKGKVDSLIIVGGQPTPNENIAILTVRIIKSGANRAGPAQKWISRRIDGKWQSPEPLPALCMDGTSDNFLFFSSDGKRVYVTRNLGYIYIYDVDDLW